jgi:transcriptional regulator with XRE-family HTH domain
VPHREPTIDEAKGSIAIWIRDWLDRTGWKQVHLAEELDVTEATLTNILNGTVKPGFKVLIRLHLRLGTPMHELIRYRTGESVVSAPRIAEHTAKVAGRK